MSLSDDQRRFVLSLLTADEPLERGAERAGLSVTDARAWIDAYLAEKAQLGPASPRTQVTKEVEIARDQRGVPHVFAEHAWDLAFGLGYAEAQDRLWQLDYLRRQAHGTLSEVFGAETLPGDVLSRTLDISGIAEAAYQQATPASREALDGFAAGVNAWMAILPTGLPVEFELLGYQPATWQPQDSLAVIRRWWWYLTGRLNVLTTPEAVRAAVGGGERYAAFFSPDGPLTTILQPGDYDPTNPWPNQPMAPERARFGASTFPAGSNNWVAGPSATADGATLLGSDPHVYFSVPADWYEAHLHMPTAEAFGVTYPSMPGVLIGRNRRVAWGLTNNICSLRDLYIEELHPTDESQYRDGAGWATIRTRTETIRVKGAADHTHTTRYAHDRPIVDHLLPATALPAALSPGSSSRSALSLAWVGLEPSDETACLLELSRAASVDEAREAFRIWRCPTFNMVFADDTGNIGYQCVGALPLRGRDQRGYRSANDPLDTWQGTIPFDGLPRITNPDRGWISSANNPTAPPDFPYPLFGTWAPEDRAARAEHLLSTLAPHSLETFERMQSDVYSGRAERGTRGLLGALDGVDDPRLTAARDLLQSWDFEMTVDSSAASVYYVFLWKWHRRVIAERFEAHLLPLAIDSGWGLSAELLHANVATWFPSDAARVEQIQAAFAEAISWLAETHGEATEGWNWGTLHRLGAVHPAARTALQHELLDIPARPHAGGASTLAAAFYSPPGSFGTRLGANYRLIAALNERSQTRSICWPGQSGHAGSPYYRDQVDAHLSGRYVPVDLDPEAVRMNATSRIRLTPA